MGAIDKVPILATPMTLNIRFSILLGILCAGLGLGMFALYTYEKHETKVIMVEIREQRTALLDRLTVLLGESLHQFIYEYAEWTEMVEFVAADKPDIEWAEVNLYTALDTYQSQAAWLLKPDGELFYALELTTLPERHVPDPPPLGDLIALIDRDFETHFFFESEGEFYEARARPILSSDGLGEQQGYMVVARRWDKVFLTKISKLLDSHIKLMRVNEKAPHPGAQSEFGFHLYRELPDMHGKPLRILDVNYHAPELRKVAEGDRWEATIFFGYGVIAICMIIFFSYRWVLRPLKHISNSLSAADQGPLEHLLGEKSEVGHVANLVKSAFQNREDLREALDERERLGRDLHDGVIQTLYASGMSLASIQATMKSDPDEAEILIDQTRRELNATIRDVRNFITRLEPEKSTPQSFDKALRSLLDFMKGGLDIECTLDIDETLDALLPLDIRAELLQITREAASNAFRHSECTQLHVALRSEIGGIILEVTDNGCGFDPANPAAPGHGLDNFQERALALNGTLDIESSPGHGTTIKFNIPLEPTL